MAQIFASRKVSMPEDVVRTFLTFKNEIPPYGEPKLTMTASRAGSSVHFLSVSDGFISKSERKEAGSPYIFFDLCRHILFFGPNAAIKFDARPVQDGKSWVEFATPAQKAHLDALIKACNAAAQPNGVPEDRCRMADRREPQIAVSDCTWPSLCGGILAATYLPMDIPVKSTVARLRITAGEKRYLVTVVGDLVDIKAES